MPLRKTTVVAPENSRSTRYSTWRKEFVHPTGVQTLDYYLGGGIVDKSICVLEDCDFASHLSRTFIRNFIHAGKENGEKVVIVGKSYSFSKAFLTSAKNEDSVMEEAADSAKEVAGDLKIAWRYEYLPKVSDVEPVTATDNRMPQVADENVENFIELDSFTLGLPGIQNALQNIIMTNKTKAVRVVLYNFSSCNFSSKSDMYSYSSFAYFVKSLISLPDSNALFLFDVSRRGLAETSMLPKLRHFSDYYILIASFDQMASSVVDTNYLFAKDHLGFLTILKVPYVNNVIPQVLEDCKFGVKKRRQQLLLERLHLPPDLSDSVSSYPDYHSHAGKRINKESPFYMNCERSESSAGVSVPVRPLTLRQRFSTFVCKVRSPPDAELEKCEKKLLSGLTTLYKSRPVYITDSRYIWTMSFGEDGPYANRTPLVLVHGFGAGSVLWMHNLDKLVAHRPVYTIDLLGFARSSRSHLDSDPEKTADDWAETVEQWRAKMGLESMYLLAHSLGGFLASIYALHHPERIKRLVLVEPWGYNEPPKDENGQTIIHRPLLIRMIIRLMFIFHPLSVLRVAGPLGPRIIEKVRPDLGRKYAPSPDAEPYIYKYIHLCNTKCPPAGETAFKRLVDKNGYPLVPMIRRIGQLPLSVPVSVIQGEESWLESNTGKAIQQARAAFHNVNENSSRVDFHLVEQAGHHLYVEQADQFNVLVNTILRESERVLVPDTN